MAPKFKVGDLVRCTSKSHTWENPFVIDVVSDVEPFVYYSNSPNMSMETYHNDTALTGCLEEQLRLVKEEGDGS